MINKIYLLIYLYIKLINWLWNYIKQTWIENYSYIRLKKNLLLFIICEILNKSIVIKKFFVKNLNLYLIPIKTYYYRFLNIKKSIFIILILF